MPASRTKNRRPSGDRKANRTSWKTGQSGNPAGRPKKGTTWAGIIKGVGELTAVEAADWAAVLAKRLRPLGDRVTLREAAVLSAFAGTIFDPSPGTLSFLADHAEGKLPVQPIAVTDWRDYFEAEGVDPDRVLESILDLINAKK